MQETEFRRLHKIFKLSLPHAEDCSDQHQNTTSSTSIIWKYGMPALINFQFHLIARIDDTTQVIMDHIQVHHNFDNALKTQLNWSKNVQDERDAPWQVILGSMNPMFCNFISLGLWLEINLQSNPSPVAIWVFSRTCKLICCYSPPPAVAATSTLSTGLTARISSI
jgi:hypothetical protein